MTEQELKEIFKHFQSLKTGIEKEMYLKSIGLTKADAERLQEITFDLLMDLTMKETKNPEVIKKLQEFKAYHENQKILLNGLKNTYLDN